MIHAVAVLGDGTFSLRVDGHEGHVEDGVVCAAISAITQGALIQLSEIARKFPDIVSIDITEE